MTDVSVLGLGLMGSALARALLAGGRSVTAWNRTAVKAQPLVELGAAQAESVAAAVGASPVLVVCVDNYVTTEALLTSGEVAGRLTGKTIVQLSTGTPNEAAVAEQRYASLGADYLDGVVLGSPSDVGQKWARLVYSGSRTVFDRVEPLLKHFAEDSRFVGERPGAAEALDFAWISELFGVFIGTAHGARICQAEGVDLEQYAALFSRHDTARWIIDIIRSEAYAAPGATINTWHGAIQHIQQQAGDAGLNAELPDFVAGIVGRAVSAGLGEEHVAALVKVLGPVSPSG